MLNSHLKTGLEPLPEKLCYQTYLRQCTCST